MQLYERRGISGDTFVRLMNRFLPTSIHTSDDSAVKNLFNLISSGVFSWFSCFETAEGLIFCHNQEPNKFIVLYNRSNFYLLSPSPIDAKDVLEQAFLGSSFVYIDLD